MKKQLSILTGALIAFCLPHQAGAQAITARAHFGPQVQWDDITKVQIKNLQGETLGRIKDLTLDLSNGRVMEVLVVSDQILGMGGKTVAVPPLALIPDSVNKTYQINMSAETFADAPAFDLSKWAESTTPDKVAAAYHYFGQVPYFLVPGEAAGRTTPSGREVLNLGTVERMSKLINLPVANLKGTRLGRLQSFVLDVPDGRILSVYIQTPTTENMEMLRSSETVIAPTLLSFNDKRDGLILDVSKVEYSDEPHIILENNADGRAMAVRDQVANNGSRPMATASEPAPSPLTNSGFVQGTSSHDISTTDQIYQSIQSGNYDATNRVEVCTLQGRVTLRGNVNNQAAKDSIGAFATNLVNGDNVDNQIVVNSQAQASL